MTTEGLFVDLWMQHKPSVERPLVQLIGIQKTPKPNEFKLRLSDKLSYIDCIFAPRYSCELADTTLVLRGQQVIRRLDIIRLDDFQTRPQPNTISGLAITVKKLGLHQRSRMKLGRPEELCQFVSNEGIGVNNEHDIKVEEGQMGAEWEHKTNIQKLYEASVSIEDLRLKRKTGVLLGRVFKKKVKTQKRENGLFSILVFHVIDKVGDSIKCELMGMDALKNDKKIRNGFIYEFGGFQLSFNSYINSFIVKFNKDYEISQIDSAWLDTRFLRYRFTCCTEEMLNSKQNLSVDLVGAIIQIGQPQEKVVKKSGEKSNFCSAKISSGGRVFSVSFWRDNVDALHNMLLIEKQPVILTDLSLKQGFLEFTSDSCILRLNDDRMILLSHPEFSDLVRVDQKQSQIVTLSQFKQMNTNGNVLVYAYVTEIMEHNVYSVKCKECDRRLKMNDTECSCQSKSLHYRFSAYFTIADHTASINCTAFDQSAIPFFSNSTPYPETKAQSLNEHFHNGTLDTFLRSFILNKQYLVTLVTKKDMMRDSRYVIKAMEPVQGQTAMKKLLENLGKARQAQKQ